MKKSFLAMLLIQQLSGAYTTLSAQTDPGGGDPADPASSGVASDPCIPNASTWFLGGNNIIPSTPVNGGVSMNHTDIGTCNNYPFILKANNFQSVWVTQTGQIGINTSLPQSALDITHPNSIQPRTRFRVYGDADGNVESTGDMRLHWAAGKDMMFNEGPVGSGLNWMVVKGTTGRVGIGESNPGAALDIKSSNIFNNANFRIHGDIFGNVESVTSMNLNYAAGNDFQINEGPAFTTNGYTGTNRLKIFKNTGYFLLGQPDMYTPYTKFHVTNSVDAGGGSATGEKFGMIMNQNVHNGGSNVIYGIDANVGGQPGICASGIGIMGSSVIMDQNSTGNNYNYGVWGLGKGGNTAIGVLAEGTAMNDLDFYDPLFAAKSVGVYCVANATQNGDGFGIESYALKNSSHKGNVWAGLFWGDVMIMGNPGLNPASQQVSPNPPPGSFALEVHGNALTTAASWYVSDRKLKREITPLSNMSDRIRELGPSSYFYKSEEYKEFSLPATKQMGLIAQDLEQVFPELVMEKAGTQVAGKDGNVSDLPAVKTVNYVGLIPVLIAGLQEQITRNDEQQEQIEQLKAEIARMKEGGDIRSREIQTGSAAPAAQLENAIVLDQNVPNPFNETTVISYFVPENSRKAMIVFTSEDGRTARSVELQSRGAGKITVFAEDLTHGTYTYSLVIDGRTVESKRMIRQ